MKPDIFTSPSPPPVEVLTSFDGLLGWDEFLTWMQLNSPLWHRLQAWLRNLEGARLSELDVLKLYAYYAERRHVELMADAMKRALQGPAGIVVEYRAIDDNLADQLGTCPTCFGTRLVMGSSASGILPIPCPTCSQSPSDIVEDSPASSEGAVRSPLYPPRTNVWLILGNKPAIGMVYSAGLEPEFGAQGELVWRYNVWPSETLHGVRRELCVSRRENELHPTREALLDALRQQA